MGGRDLVALGAAMDVPERAVRRVLLQVIERADLWLPNLDHLPFDEGRIRNLRRVVDYRRKRLSQ